MNASGTIMSDSTVDVFGLILMVDRNHRHHDLAARSGQATAQRLAPRNRPAVKAIDDHQVCRHDDRQRPTIREDRLRQQFEIAFEDRVRIVVIRLEGFPIDEPH